MKKHIEEAIIEARATSLAGYGGPFGACVVKDNKVISVGSNLVVKNNDPTAHAEINAIRKACEALKTYSLKDCVLYTTSYPCPMCMSAIIWANIKKVFYVLDVEEAENIGFRDDFIYEFLRGENKALVIEKIDIDWEELEKECKKLFAEYKGEIY